MSVRVIAGVCLLALAGYLSLGDRTSPPPAPDGPLVLRGLFVGQDAAEDAAILAAMSAEIADEMEWDGRQPSPLLTTGVAMDELRTRAMDARMAGVSMGDRQQQVRAAVSAYLTDHVGIDGGPLTDAQRAAWVSAYRTIAEAASAAIR